MPDRQVRRHATDALGDAADVIRRGLEDFMRNLYRSTAAALVLMTAIAFAPSARATGYEDSLDDCAYPESFDVFVMRPLAFTGLMLGSVSLVALAPVWAAFDARDAGTLVHNLVVSPASFAFSRRIGQCAANSGD